MQSPSRNKGEHHPKPLPFAQMSACTILCGYVRFLPIARLRFAGPRLGNLYLSLGSLVPGGYA